MWVCSFLSSKVLIKESNDYKQKIQTTNSYDPRIIIILMPSNEIRLFVLLSSPFSLHAPLKTNLITGGEINIVEISNNRPVLGLR